MDAVPAYVSIIFILTTFAAIGFLLMAAKRAGLETLASRVLVFVIPLWLFFQAIVAMGGYYQDRESVPPRLILLGIIPAILLIGVYLIFFRTSFIEKLPLKALTLVHIVRIPVELVLYWLAAAHAVPRMMTFTGYNFDIISGIAAPIVYWFAFRGGEMRRGLILVFNIFGLLLLINIISIAALSLPSPLQQLNYGEANKAVLYFPYVWLPTIVVPIVLFSHLASIYKLLAEKEQ